MATRDERPCTLSVVEAARRIRAGELSPVALVESSLEQIERYDGALRAWVYVAREEALAEAREAEAAVRAGRPTGPLHGVPFGVKDIYHVKGVGTGAGSWVMQGVVPDEDAAAVARLREAGGIFLGKTATTEFAYAGPAQTRNPWNPSCTPGGSSSGSAAAAAARMVPCALGSQTAGSLSRPAAFCGVTTVKPTYGRISRYGVLSLSWTLDHAGCARALRRPSRRMPSSCTPSRRRSIEPGWSKPGSCWAPSYAAWGWPGA